MQELRLNFYDFVTFPDREARDQIRRQYPVLGIFHQIRIRLDDKYQGEQPIELIMGYPSVSARIQELNHRMFMLLIPAFQMVQAYGSYKEADSEEKARYLKDLFYHYSEIVGFLITVPLKSLLTYAMSSLKFM